MAGLLVVNTGTAASRSGAAGLLRLRRLTRRAPPPPPTDDAWRPTGADPAAPSPAAGARRLAPGPVVGRSKAAPSKEWRRRWSSHGGGGSSLRPPPSPLACGRQSCLPPRAASTASLTGSTSDLAVVVVEEGHDAVVDLVWSRGGRPWQRSTLGGAVMVWWWWRR
jgi:hypothetical protein